MSEEQAKVGNELEAEFRADLEQLKNYEEGHTRETRKRLLLWAIRWAIGFGLIAIAVYFNPDWSWLWWVGAAVAALSLALIVVSSLFLKRKLARTTQKMSELEERIQDIDNDEINPDEARI